MELKELTEKTCKIFNCADVGQLGSSLMRCVIENNIEQMAKFHELVCDLSVDWLQKIFQYYQADRKEKMQDYTPKSVAKLMGRLAGEADTVIDMCAGSGALTIQRWNQKHNQSFVLYELDEKVIPYLLFNLTVRNIKANVKQSDVLQQEVYREWIVIPGQKYGEVKEVHHEHSIDI